MGRFLALRLLGAIPLLIAITFLSFLIVHLAPGDPASMMMDSHLSVADRAAYRQTLGLDDPLILQYFKWGNRALHGDLGYSIVSTQPVLEVILDRVPATLILSLSSLILMLLVTFPLGLWTGYKHGTRFDFLVAFFSFVGMAMPTFWVGLILILVFSLSFGIFPSSGYLSPDLGSASFWLQSLDIMWHMALPLLTMLIGGVAGLIRFNRFGVIAILNESYIQAARARGISERRLVFVHAFKNAALPIVTLLGASLPSLLGGAFVIEYIFAWPGMGQLGVSAIFSRDYPVIMGTLLMSSVLVVLGNILADYAYHWVDPRVRMEE